MLIQLTVLRHSDGVRAEGSRRKNVCRFFERLNVVLYVLTLCQLVTRRTF